MRWAEHVVQMGKKRNAYAYRILVETQKERECKEGQDIGWIS
jgi:hypothetical protein